MRIDHILFGFCDLCVAAEDATAFLNVCAREGWVYQPLKQNGTEEAPMPLWVRIRRTTLPSLSLSLAKAGVEVHIQRTGGLPLLVYRYRLRIGLMIGFLLAAALLWASGNVVWDVRIDGEGEIQVPHLEQALQTCGLGVGEWIPALDTDEIERRLLRSDAGVAWVTVNMKGTVAYVQVRPLLSPEQPLQSVGPGNLVAATDGVVESIRLMSGEVVVHPGEIVRKGQLLISGIRDVGEEGYVLSAAEGQVMARTTKEILIEIPLLEEKKVYTGEKKSEKTLFFFGKAIKIAKSTGISGGNCDTIKRMEICSLFGRCALPISIETVTECSYEWQTVALTPQEAQTRAQEQLARELILATRDGVLLSKTVQIEMTEETCSLRCTYVSLENIAVSRPIETAP